MQRVRGMQRHHARDEGGAAGGERGRGGVARAGELDGLSGGGQRGGCGARGVGCDAGALRPVVEVAGFVARLLQCETHLSGVVARSGFGCGARLNPVAASSAELFVRAVDHRAAAQRDRRRASPHEIEVAGRGDDGAVELDLRIGLRAGFQLFKRGEDQVSRRLGRVDVEHDGRAGLQGFGVDRQMEEAHVEEAVRVEVAGRRDDLATRGGFRRHDALPAISWKASTTHPQSSAETVRMSR